MSKIDTIWAVVTLDGETGREVLCAANVGGEPVPLAVANPERVAWLNHHAGALADAMGQPVKVIRLTRRDVVETFKPAPRKAGMS